MADDPKNVEIIKATRKAVEKAIEDERIPKIYTNGFSLGLSNADVMIVFNRFGNKPTAMVNLSYTLAKTLAQRLGALISEFETKANQQMLTTDRIDEAMKPKTAEEAAEQGDDDDHDDEATSKPH